MDPLTTAGTSAPEAARDAAPAVPRLAGAGRVVVKIGSSLLVDRESGQLRRAWLDALVDDVAALIAGGTEMILVSSGAIAMGRRRLGLTRRPIRLEESQAAAATGQIFLAHAYQESLARHGLTCAQILLTLSDTEERRRYLNARSTIRSLLKLGAVPIVNENDTVATQEIRFGDNDRLAARVAEMATADALVLLSDIDGLYTADPRHDPEARHLGIVEHISPAIEAMAGSAGTGDASGGMVTKLVAAKIAINGGTHMAITDGRVTNPLRRLADGAKATWFVSQKEPRQARKTWIAGTLKPRGALTVDAGAEAALKRGTSLLPAGITGVTGWFERGDAVVVRGPGGREIGRGLIAYGSEDARRIAGHKSGEIREMLGYRGRDEMIHRDDLVLLDRTGAEERHPRGAEQHGDDGRNRGCSPAAGDRPRQ